MTLSVSTLCGGRLPGCRAWPGGGPPAWPLMPAAQGPPRSPGSRPARRAVAAGDARAAWRPEGRPRTLRGTPPGNSGGEAATAWSWSAGGVAVQDLGQGLGRGLPAQRLAGPAVQLLRHRGQLARAVPGQGRALGEVLAQQPVGVLVAAPLPGRVRVAEVDLDVRV